jgi:hypothetical protein
VLKEKGRAVNSIVARPLRGVAVLAALLVLATGAAALNSTSVHAQSPSSGSSRAGIGALTVDGLGMTQGCAAGDSWCAYCTNNSAADICAQLQPATASGNGTVAGNNNSGNAPVPGVEAGLPGTPASAAAALGGIGVAGMSTIAPGLISPIGVSWQWCSLTGFGGVWVPAGTTASGLSC